MSKEAARELDEAAAAIATEDEYGDYVGCPGIRRVTWQSPPCSPAEVRFDAARAAYISAVRESHRQTMGPMLRDYYSRSTGE